MTSRALRMIYREIPRTSACKASCVDCCGPVPWAAEEFALVQADLPLGSRMTTLLGSLTVENPATGKCAFASPAGCRVYDRRPFMCRLFGAVAGEPLLACPHGVRAARPLSPRQAAALRDRYDRHPQLAPAALGATQAAPAAPTPQGNTP